MSKVMLLVGTRKGCFVLESDGDRRDWHVRGPFCEGWPVYHAIYDHDDGTIYAAAASEWHGAAVWRSADLGETWDAVERGPRLRRRRRAEGVQGLEPGGSARTTARGHARRRASSRARDGGQTWTSRTPEHASPGGRTGTTRASSRPAISASRRSSPTRTTAAALLGDRPGLQPLRDDRRRRVVDGPQQRSPRGLAARVRRDRLLRPQARPLAGGSRAACTSRTTAACTDRTTAAHSWTEITEGLPSDFGFAAAVHPHDRDTFYVVPVDPGHARTCTTARRRSGGLATPARPGSARRRACRSRTRTSACCARG